MTAPRVKRLRWLNGTWRPGQPVHAHRGLLASRYECPPELEVGQIIEVHGVVGYASRMAIVCMGVPRSHRIRARDMDYEVIR